MASIQTGIQLNDQFSGVIYGIINSVNIAVSAMADMQQTMNADIDMGSIDAARQELTNATLAADELNQAMQNIGSSPIQTPTQPSTVPPVQQQVQWQSDGLEVFDTSGVQRWEQEVQSAEQMLEQLNDTQSQIARQASGMDVLDPNAINDLTQLGNRIQSIQDSIRQIENDQINIGTDTANAELEQLRSQLNQAIEQRDELNQAMLVDRVTSTSETQRVPTPSMQPVTVPVKWTTPDNMDIFTNTGIERFQQELQSANSLAQQLAITQQTIAQQSANTTVFSDSATSDIENLGNRIQEIQDKIQEIESNPVELDDRMNNQLEVLRSQLTSAIQEQNNLNQAVASMDVSSANESFAKLQQTVGATERYIRDNLTQPVAVPVEIQWNNIDVDVFTGTGIERFRQEVSSTNQMLDTLANRQNQIAQNASNTDIFSETAIRDITSMDQRIQAVQYRIQQIENNPLNLGSDTANAELEQLRSKLNQALQAQEQLNRAVGDMDVSAANAAYNQLSQTIGNTERHIRDNVDEQGRFTRSVEQTQIQSDRLMGTIKRTVAAYATIESIKGAVGVSDELTQTAARLETMNDGVQTTDELLQMTYAAAQNTRGEFSDMADVVARFGNNAGDAFGSSAEVVSFANLIQKQMTIAGASTQEASNAMLQLSQALGSGVLRGDELNSIFEQSPNLIRGIANYIENNDALLDKMAGGIKMKSADLKGKVMSHIRDIASEGLISADIVKASVFSAADEINAKFEAMPITWGQVWTSFKNTAMMAFRPVLQQMNDLANSEDFQIFLTNAANDLAVVAGVVLDIFSAIGSVAGFVSDNWGMIAPVILTAVAAWAAYNSVLGVYNTIQAVSNTLAAISAAREAFKTGVTTAGTVATFGAVAAQEGLNAALLACPLTWIILLIIALIAVLITVTNHIANMGGTATTAFGVVCGGVNVAIQFFKNLGLSAANIVLGIGNAVAALGSNIITAFHNAISEVQSFWYDLLSTAMTVINSICSALNELPFVEFDYSGVTQAADDYAAKSAEASSRKKEYTSISDAFNDGNSAFDAYQKGWVSDAYASGAKFGDGVSDKLKKSVSSKATKLPDTSKYDKLLNDVAANAAAQQTAANTGKTADSANKIAKSVDIASEDLKYLRDIAERDVVNRYTTASINVKQTNHNTIKNNMDLDGVTEHLRTTVEEQMAAAAEGVY